MLQPLVSPNSPLRMQSLKSQTLKPEESASHHVFLVPGNSYDDLMVGSLERRARRPPLPHVCLVCGLALSPRSHYLVPAVNRQPGYRRGNSQICSTIILSTCYLHTLTSFSGACSGFLMHVVISERSVIFSHIAWCFPLLRCCCPRLSCYVSLDACCSHI